MDNSDENAGNVINRILCIEIAVEKNALHTTSGNLRWVLSVYSLENKPAVVPFAEEQGVTFHFMVYDWRRTIKRLLDSRNISYKIIRYFSPDSVFCGADETISKVSDEKLSDRSSHHEVNGVLPPLVADPQNISSDSLFEELYF